MTSSQRLRYDAAHLLALCASGRGETLSEIAAAIGLNNPAAVRLARWMLFASMGAGNWREVRAEAEARLRS